MDDLHRITILAYRKEIEAEIKRNPNPRHREFLQGVLDEALGANDTDWDEELKKLTTDQPDR